MEKSPSFLSASNKPAVPLSPTSNTPVPVHQPNSAQIRAQTSFFSTLIKTGYPFEVNNSGKWIQHQFKFSPEACALESLAKPDDPTSKLTAYISLRKFVLSFHPLEPNQVSIKTPNKLWQLRFRDAQIRALSVAWFNSVQDDSAVMAQNALLLSNATQSTSPNAKPRWWIPSDFCDFCASCHTALKSFAQHSCRSCGYMYCSASQCYSNDIKKCNYCLVHHQPIQVDASTGQKDVTNPLNALEIATFDDKHSTTSRIYFSTITSDPLLNPKPVTTQLNIDSQNNLTSSPSTQLFTTATTLPTTIVGEQKDIPRAEPSSATAAEWSAREQLRSGHYQQLQQTAYYGDVVLITFATVILCWVIFGDQITEIAQHVFGIKL